MIEIEAPDGSIIEFPEGTDDRTIEGAMRRAYPSQSDAVPPVPSPDVQPDQTSGRTGDFLKPMFGGHNPVAEVYDDFVKPLFEENSSQSDGYADSFGETVAMGLSLPVRALTQGKVGFGDVLKGLGADEAGRAQLLQEGDFAQHHAKGLGVLKNAGDLAMGLPGAGAGVRQNLSGVTSAENATAKSVRGMLRMSKKVASGKGTTARIHNRQVALQEFKNADVPVHNPSLPHTPLGGGFAKRLGQTLLGKPIQRSLDKSVDAVRENLGKIADDISPVATHDTLGRNIQAGLDRYTKSSREASNLVEGVPKNVKPSTRKVDMSQLSKKELEAGTLEDFSVLDNQQLSKIIHGRTSDTSQMTKGGAMFEAAWRKIPASKGRGRAVDGETRFMGSMKNTREVLGRIMHEKGQMRNSGHGTWQSAIKDDALLGISGDLGAIFKTIRENGGNFTIDTMRKVRSEVRRRMKTLPDTERNALSRSQADKIHNAITKDTVGVLERNAVSATGKLRSELTGSIRAFKAADRFYAMAKAQKELLDPIIKNKNPTAAAKKIETALRDGSRGDHDMVRTIRQASRPGEWDQVTSVVLRGMSKDGIFKMHSTYHNMHSKSRDLLFGSSPKAIKHRRAIDDLMKVVDRLKNFEKEANFSQSGIAAADMGQAALSTAALLSGQVHIAIGVPLSQHLISRMIASSAYTKWLTRGMVMSAKAKRSGRTVRNTPSWKKHISELVKMAKRDPDMGVEILRVIGAQQNDRAKK